jgi:tetratricopeptide (TPR) repeat protein
LQVDKPVVISAVSGMGGIGKSELALQYAFVHLTTTYPGGICWLKAREDLGLQIVEFARIYANLEPPTDWDLVEKVRWCWQQWRDAATLIIFDDVQGYSDIQPFFPPPKSQFRVLLTSRSKFPAPVQDCEIKVLIEARSIELLGSFSADVKSSIDADLATSEKICHWLGYLPLGLELVGRYLAKKPDLSLAEMWKRLQAQRLTAKALQTSDKGIKATLGVIAAFELSWQDLTPAAQELAARLSLFAQSEIPWWLVEDCLEEWDKEELEDLRDEIFVTASLLTRTRQGMYEIHQLLREFFALKLAEMPQQEEFMTKFARFLTIIAKVIPPIVTVQHQKQLIEVIPHLTAATEFLQYLENADKFWSCLGLGRFYEAQSQFTQAEFWIQQSLYICKKNLGTNHPDTASSMDNLARLYQVTGRYSEAETMYIQSLAIREELGAEHLDTATGLNNLAGLYRLIGSYPKAESLFIRSLAIRKQHLGEDHLDTVQTIDNLALLYSSMGRWWEAEPLHKNALDVYRQQLGEDHLDTAIAMNNLAEIYRAMGRYAEAEPLYLQSISITTQHLGINHPETASILNNLAFLYKSSSKYTEAEPLYLLSLAIREDRLGTNHPDTAVSMNNLAALYRSMNRDPEAEPLYVRAVNILEQKLGAEHPHTTGLVSNLAKFYYSVGRCSEAESLLERLLEVLEDKLDANHPSTQTIRNNLHILRQ